MSDSEDNSIPFQLPGDTPKVAGETFGERLRRRRQELGDSQAPPPSSWQSRARNLVALVVESPHASASIIKKNSHAAAAIEGIETVLFAEDLPPFHNTLGHEYSGEPLLAEDEVFFRGQPIALVVGVDFATCQKAAELLEVDYHTTPGILTLDHAIAMGSHHNETRSCQRGDAQGQLKSSEEKLTGTLTIAPQQACLAGGNDITISPERNGQGVKVHSRCLLPTAVRTAVAFAYDLPESRVHLEPVELPGPIGALETEPVRLTALAAHAAKQCDSTVTLKLNSQHSPLAGGTRHEAKIQFEAGFTKDGKITAVNLDMTLDGGWFAADSENAMDRALLHGDSVYGIPHLKISARLCKTNRIVSSSLPAEGAAQGTWAMEELIQRVAIATGLASSEVRQKNFYQEEADLKTTPYGQPLNAAAINRVWNQVMTRSNFEERVKTIEEWNSKNHCYKRGIAALPLKFGIGDPRSERNAATVIVQILADGSVVIRVGLVDTNDGIENQIREEVSHFLGVEEDSIRVILNDFDSLPRATSVVGTDASGLILRALDNACLTLLDRLREVALQLFAARGQTEVEMETIRFSQGLVKTDVSPANPIHFKELIEGAWRKRINLIETGYHRTPNLWWDSELGAGWPFSSFTYAAAVSEIQVDALTGEIQILRLDVAHDGSPSANQGDRDFAQLMRAFTLGAGWMLSETVPAPDSENPDIYPTEEGVPGFADAAFEVVTDRLRPLGDNNDVAGDPCGEAPVILAGSLREALRNALSAFGLSSDLDVEIPLPSTPPRVLATFKEISRQIQEKDKDSFLDN